MICFLDFDGVTHPHPANGDYFRKENIAALNQCLSKYNLSIVISSSWRLDMDLDDIKIALQDLNKTIIGMTPEINDPFLKHPRQIEVELYLKQTNQVSTPWFAIDDTPAFYKPDAPVIFTDTRKGFVNENCTQTNKLILSISDFKRL